ncbi:DUF4893 domain-containing protein [Sphingorhabdus soli]|uniref:DUF4893 domain-containing protein n=1 Tax=Flavisphingopyxis soli TaxID=2601267 RepID=A0A5C6U935_9SPHN|nr:DUF4893 domain-containing protein [Sphingorhabdus soli]TXC68671.1 DUF4893 domain-containing protein [Sphingorhabdus soli]
MTGRRAIAIVALALAAGGCQTIAPSAPAEVADQRPTDWRSVASTADRKRIAGWRTAWVAALRAARAAGHGDELAARPALFDPDAALPNPYIPPGDYRCRTTKLGAKSAGLLDYVAYGWFTCRIAAEQDIFSFAKLTGSQRPVGLLFDDSDRRQVFLGTLQLGDESGIIDYGIDGDRDMAGLVERIGANRWRLVLPYPAFESLLDVIEISPPVD